MDETCTYTAFIGDKLVATGPLTAVLSKLKARFDRHPHQIVLIFEDRTGRSVDFDFRGTLQEVLERAMPPARTGPGRPKLGVVSREISLLPRHWTWLEEQPNGASAALRRLIDEAKNRECGRHRVRLAMEAASRFMTAMAGNLPGYEEATRALFAADRDRFERLIERWPRDIRAHTQSLARNIFHAEKTRPERTS